MGGALAIFNTLLGEKSTGACVCLGHCVVLSCVAGGRGPPLITSPSTRLTDPLTLSLDNLSHPDVANKAGWSKNTRCSKSFLVFWLLNYSNRSNTIGRLLIRAKEPKYFDKKAVTEGWSATRSGTTAHCLSFPSCPSCPCPDSHFPTFGSTCMPIARPLSVYLLSMPSLPAFDQATLSLALSHDWHPNKLFFV